MPLPIPTRTDLHEKRLLAIAREIALDMDDVSDILARYDIDGREWTLINDLPFFRNAVGDYRSSYASPEGQAERASFKARVLLEDALPKLHEIVHDDRYDPPGRVSAAKLLAEVGGLGRKEAGGGGGKVVINMDFGAGGMTAVSGVAPAIVIDHEE